MSARSRLPRAATRNLYCQGTPLRNEILSRAPDGLEEATEIARSSIAERFGETNIDGAMRAHVVTARKA